MFAYDYERFILKSFKLHDVATMESIEICMTLEGLNYVMVFHT